MNENDLTDEELEKLENSTAVTEDVWDRLEQFRILLNDSRLESMYVIKRGTSLGPLCPYYKKALRLFMQDQRDAIVESLLSLALELETPEKTRE